LKEGFLLTVVGDLLIVLDRLLSDKKKSRVSKSTHKTLDQSVGHPSPRWESKQPSQRKGKEEFM